MKDWVPFFAIALFAEDIREESIGTISLLSILPDNVVLSAFPAILPKLHVYIRIAYNPGDPPSRVTCGLRKSGETPLLTQPFETPQLRAAVAETVMSGAKIGTIIARFGVENLELREPCTLNATVTWNDEEFVVGTLMIKAMPTT